MEKPDFNSEEWKERLKGKSPEEIAEIVGSYYEQKYKEEYPHFPWKILIWSLAFLIIFVIVAYLILNALTKKSP
ncbi:hypothetical protein J7L87_01015 [bacterium]|nr:hypothetical protein [bacterium]